MAMMRPRGNSAAATVSNYRRPALNCMTLEVRCPQHTQRTHRLDFQDAGALTWACCATVHRAATFDLARGVKVTVTCRDGDFFKFGFVEAHKTSFWAGRDDILFREAACS
jgi:hypothetical protein